MKKFFVEFRQFALKGNVMNLAVGVIIGAAFQKVVASLTENLISPIIGLCVGKNFDALDVQILGVNFKYGAFLTTVIDFFILAFIVFLMVKGMNRLLEIGKKPETPAAATTRKCPYCTTEISIDATRCPACTSELEKA